MTQLAIQLHRQGDPPMDFRPPSGIVIHVPDRQTLVVVEGGMQSGEPSVALLGVDTSGVGVMVETSLDKLITGTTGAVSLAKHQLGWEQPAGAMSIMPNPAGVFEGRFHLHPDDPDRLGSECTAKVCDQVHAHAVWRREDA